MPVTSFTSSVATPGTPQRLIAGASPALPTLSGVLSGTIAPRGYRVAVTSDPGNTAGKTLFLGGPSLNVAANTGWFAKIAPGGNFIILDPGNGVIDPSDVWIDTDGTTAVYGVEVIG